MRKFVVVIGILLVWNVSYAQTPTKILVDFQKAKLVWDWAKGQGGDVERFNVKCGVASGQYTMISGLTCPECREVLVSSVVSGPGEFFCVVSAENRFGESGVSNEVHFEAGLVPLAPANLRMVIP